MKVSGSSTLEGNIIPPGDKSIAHRAVILNSIAKGKSVVTNFCPGRDSLASVHCMKSLGVKIRRGSGQPHTLEINGVSKNGFHEPGNILNANNSGTTMRLISGLLAGQDFLSIITGDASLRSRPMDRIIKPLRMMGVDIRGRRGGLFAPLVIQGCKLHGMEYTLGVPSAQVKSALLIASLFAKEQTKITEPAPTRDHTERMLKQMGSQISKQGSQVTLLPSARELNPLSFDIPGDISAAAYWLVAAAAHPNAKIRIKNCGMNPTRTGVIDVLISMGAILNIEEITEEDGEPRANLIVQSSRLKATEISGDIVVRAIDEIPILAVAACFADGVTTIRGAGELRVKESDRISHTVCELSKMGASIQELTDGMIIRGVRSLKGAHVNSHGDHRLAMCLAIAGLLAKGETIIIGAEASNISYPQFWDDLYNIANNVIEGVKCPQS
ncbi:3-phosphoshikimate 1-carboxyvinyltransferase [Chloroflexota bacterium]